MLFSIYEQNICHTCLLIKKRQVWKLLENTYHVAEFLEAYSEPSQKIKNQHFVEIINTFELLIIFLRKLHLKMFDWFLNTALFLSHSY